MGARGYAVWCFEVCEKVQLQESKVTEETEKEGGVRRLSLELSRPSIARRSETQVLEGRGFTQGHG